MGPVVGVVGALLADLALDWLMGDSSRAGIMHNFNGKQLKLRAIRLAPRPGCRLCDPDSSARISTLNRELYGAHRPGATPSLGQNHPHYH
jgi:hypothetical protein